LLQGSHLLALLFLFGAPALATSQDADSISTTQSAHRRRADDFCA